MASIKLKFRPSDTEGKPGMLYYCLIHKRKIKQIKSGYHIFPAEWDNVRAEIIVPPCGERRITVALIRDRMNREVLRLQKLSQDMDQRWIDYTVDQLVYELTGRPPVDSVFTYMRIQIEKLIKYRRVRTSETYHCALKKMIHFRQGKDFGFDAFDHNLMADFQAFMLASGLKRNTTSFYMRIWRAVYHRAVDAGLTVNNLPFKHIYTGIDKTRKRALPLSFIKKLRGMDFTSRPQLDLARDLFLFSFYTRGMSFVDMAYLKKTDLIDHNIIYCRQKTRKKLYIQWDGLMQEVVDKYSDRIRSSPYLLPIISQSDGSERTQYLNMLKQENRYLKQIGEMMGAPFVLTHYVARHSWASAAQDKHISIDIIREGMGHNSENTTRIYLASIEKSLVNKANQKILCGL